jgi:sugar phosphate isomerase/epimerase
MERLGIEFLSVFGLPPVDFVNLAADLGCAYIGTALGPGPIDPPLYPPFSLKDDPALRRDMLAAMRDRGVSVSLGDGFVVGPDRDIRDCAEDLEIMAELGAPRVNTISFDPDVSRSTDEIGTLVEMAADAGMETTIESSPGFTPGDLSAALDIISAVGRPDLRLLVDTMHVIRGGATPADLAALDPDTIGYVQLSDVPLTPVGPTYYEEALFNRMVPGRGELPLLEILAAVPRDRVISLEVPNRSQVEAGLSPHERLGQCVAAAESLLAELVERDRSASA